MYAGAPEPAQETSDKLVLALYPYFWGGGEPPPELLFGGCDLSPPVGTGKRRKEGMFYIISSERHLYIHIWYVILLHPRTTCHGSFSVDGSHDVLVAQAY